MPGPSGRCLIDTNVLIYATLRDDPRHQAAMRVFEWAEGGEIEALVSVQSLGEMYPNLTGPKRKPPDSPELARRKIESIARLRYLRLLPITPTIVGRTLELCEQLNIRRQDYFNMQLAATMLEHAIPTILTENDADFTAVPGIRAVNPF